MTGLIHWKAKSLGPCLMHNNTENKKTCQESFLLSFIPLRSCILRIFSKFYCILEVREPLPLQVCVLFLVSICLHFLQVNGRKAFMAVEAPVFAEDEKSPVCVSESSTVVQVPKLVSEVLLFAQRCSVGMPQLPRAVQDTASECCIAHLLPPAVQLP